MKNLVPAVFLLITSFAGRSFAQCGTAHCSAVIPTTPAYASVRLNNLGNTSFRVEARLHGQNWSSQSNVNILSVGGYGVNYLGGSGILRALFFNAPDSASGGFGNCDVVLGSSPSSDIIVRIDRDVPNLQVRGEVFDTASGAQIGATCVYPITTLASGGTIKSLGAGLGDQRAAALGGAVAFLRWYNASVAAGTQPAVGIPTPALLGDWEFDNNPNDSSGNGQTFAGIQNYVNTPIYKPSCVAGTPQTVQVGGTISLNASGSNALDGGTTLTYAWSYVPGSDGVNQIPTISGANTASPSISGLNHFGSADFQLGVTDSSGDTATCSVHNGVVIADSNGVIDLGQEGLDAVSQQLIGPLVMFGRSLWPWADTIHKTEMDVQINNMANYYQPFWRTAMAGTISVSAGSAIVTGTGTDLTMPCAEGNAPLNGATIFLIYPGTDGLTHYLPAQVLSCTDASHLVMSMPQGAGPNNSYPAGSPPSHTPWPDCTSGCTGWGWSWGYFGDTRFSPEYQYGNWIYNPAPGNYYDNAKAFYALYLRSGMDSYLTAFQNMADEWWEFPVMDQGYNCAYWGSSCWAPAAWRSMSLSGVVLRALEEGPNSTKWAGLWMVAQLAQSYMVNVANSGGSIDLRESGYAMSMLAYCAMADPNPTHQMSCKTSLQTALSSVWTRFRRPDSGVWSGFTYASQVAPNQATSITSLGGTGSVCLVQGSASVVGSGTSWTSAQNGFAVWFFGGNPAVGPATNAAGDSVAYGVTVNSATSLTLSSPYAGPTACTGVAGSNRGYLFGYQQGGTTPNPTNGFLGWGSLPYMQGLAGTAFGWAAMALDGYDPVSAALYRSYLHATVMWLITSGMNPFQGGLYAGSGFVGCTPPIATTNVACNGGSQSQSRTLSLDVMRAFAMDYVNTGDAQVRTAADLLMSQMFSKPGTGGPNPDGFYLSDFDGGFSTGTPPLGSAPKWAGQLCGYEEACDMWPAVRSTAVKIRYYPLAGNVTVSGHAVVP